VAGGTTAIAGRVTASKNSVTSKSIRDGNITARDLAGLTSVENQIQISDPGPSGDGASGSGTATAHCPPGFRVITGGGGTGPDRVYLEASGPSGTDSWGVTGATDNGATALVTAVAYCLPASAVKPYLPPSRH
jgi:hypothetical protein